MKEGKPPGFIIPLTIKHDKEGDTVIFECLPYGTPFPNIKWLKDGMELVPSDSIEIKSLPDGTQKLILDNVNFLSEAFYRCVATNLLETAFTEAEFKLIGDRRPKENRDEGAKEPEESKPRIRRGLYNQSIHEGASVEMQVNLFCERILNVI